MIRVRRQREQCRTSKNEFDTELLARKEREHCSERSDLHQGL